MMKTHLLGNEHPWIIQTHYPDMEEFDFHWDKKVFPPKREKMLVTQTSQLTEDRNGIFIPDAFLNEWKYKPFCKVR